MTSVNTSSGVNESKVERTTKTITFTGAAGAGEVGTVSVFTISGGIIVVEEIAGRVTTNLTGATATVALGVTGQTSLFIGATTATGLVTTAALWASTAPTAGGIALPAATKQELIDANVIITVATANVTGGVLEIDVVWRPLTAGATLVAA